MRLLSDPATLGLVRDFPGYHLEVTRRFAQMQERFRVSAQVRQPAPWTWRSGQHDLPIDDYVPDLDTAGYAAAAADSAHVACAGEWQLVSVHGPRGYDSVW